MLPKIVPSIDSNRAFRFYRDVFDFLQDGEMDNRFLIIDGEKIEFEDNSENSDIEIIARDKQAETTQHLKNYFIDFKIVPDSKDDSKIRFEFKDSENNNISLQVNK